LLRLFILGMLRRAFLVHLTVYLLVNALLIGVNLVYTPGFLWFPFPLLGWGIGVLLHYIFGVYLPGKPEPKPTQADEGN